MYINSELWSWKANPLIPFSVFHRLKLSINSPVFSQPSQWSTTFLPFIIPPHLEMFKCSRSRKEHTHTRRKAESANRNVGRAPARHCQPSQTFPNGGGSCQCFAGCLSASPNAKELMLPSSLWMRGTAPRRRSGEESLEKPQLPPVSARWKPPCPGLPCTQLPTSLFL